VATVAGANPVALRCCRAAAPEEDRLRVFRRVRNEIQQRLSLMMLAAKIPMKLPKASKA